MGYLGWAPPVCLATDVNVLQLALEGREELLESIFGSGDKEDKPSASKPMTADRFRAMAARHNRDFARKNPPGRKAVSRG